MSGVWSNPWGSPSGLDYQGLWDASTNTPTLTSGVGVRNQYYIVSVAGSTTLDGESTWNVKDWVIFNGTAWQKLDNTDLVTSVFSRVGAVAAQANDYSLDQIAAGNLTIGAYYADIQEISAPADPAANVVRLYAKDNGSGLTLLYYRDSAGNETAITETSPAGISGDIQYNNAGSFAGGIINYSGTIFDFLTGKPIIVSEIRGKSGASLGLYENSGTTGIYINNLGSVIPTAGVNLGSGSNRFGTIYGNSLDVGDSIKCTIFNGDAISFPFQYQSTPIMYFNSAIQVDPANSSVNLGDSSHRWNNLFSSYINVNNYIDIPEQTTPGNPAANVGRVYVADDSGTTRLYFRDNSGTETDLTTPAPGGSTTQLQYNNAGVLSGFDVIYNGSHVVMGDSINLWTRKVQAKDSNGLLLTEDGGKGIFIQDSDGDIGIGTSSPYGKVEVFMDYGVSPTTPPIITINNSDGVTSANGYIEIQRWQGGGTSYKGFRIKGNVGSLDIDASNATDIGSQVFVNILSLDTNGDFTCIGAGNEFKGKLIINSDNYGGINALQVQGSSIANLFCVNSGDNRIGIGTDAPDDMLDVRGTVRIVTPAATEDDVLYFKADRSWCFKMELQGGVTSRLTLQTLTDDKLHDWQSADGTTRLRAWLANTQTTGYFSYSHNVRIGNAINTPDSVLHVYENNTGTGTSNGITVEQDGSGGALIHYLRTGAQRWMTGINGADNSWNMSTGTSFSASVTKFTMLNSGRLGLSEQSPSALLDINQSSTTAAIPVLELTQADISEPFIKLIGSAASGVLTQSIVNENDVVTATEEAFFKVNVQDDGNQITDQDYFVRLYTLSL